MRLTEIHQFSSTHPFFKGLDELCFLSKNLYNAGLYVARQSFFEKNYKGYYNIQKEFQDNNQPDYYALPAKVSQQTLKLVDQDFKSYFALAKKNLKPKIPKYRNKTKGRQVVTYTNQAISFKDGYIKLSRSFIKIPTKISDPTAINQIRIVPKINHIQIEVVYTIDDVPIKEDNCKYASIDLGLNNLATLTSNVKSPVIINGKPLKSINQFFNKKLAELKSEHDKPRIKQFVTKTGWKVNAIHNDDDDDDDDDNNNNNNNKIKRLYRKRGNKVKDYLHKASRYIVNYLVSNDLNTLIIGYNQGWKQGINLGTKTNQNFVSIPFLTFVRMLEYKCKMVGITVLRQEESYTSKCSFLDYESPRKREKYKGKRVERGLFRTNNGILINADVNGSLNILAKGLRTLGKPLIKFSKKVVRKVFTNRIEVCSTPIVVTL
jgi:putative transposase